VTWPSRPRYSRTTSRPAWRRFRSLLQDCQRAGLEQVIAVIADGGDPASAALHRAAGFTDSGRLRNVGRKYGRLLDTLLMQRDLTA
jgi:phosphinothricin acetyltransferase